MNADLLRRIQEQISTSTIRARPVGGGSINDAFCLDTSRGRMFCKINLAEKFPGLFQKEKNGLEKLAEQKVIRTPGVIDCFETNGYQVLLLEWISEGRRTQAFWKNFGSQLAALHLCKGDQYGAMENNYMGSVPQDNTSSGNWTTFLEHQRLRSMITRCAGKKLLNNKHQEQFDILFNLLPGIFVNIQQPALVHGDLWSGNFMCDENEQPVLIDPAVYYGDPSVDMAMTTLFGCFNAAFYEAYQQQLPFPNNYRLQWEVCNLYPLLVHLYLFGQSYLHQIEATLNTFVS